MPRAYSYIRFSSPEQARGDSLRRQTLKAEEWCKSRGITLDDTLRDLGISAFKGANRTAGALRDFLELVEAGQIEKGSYLIVESLDRLSRDTVLAATTQLIALIHAGIRVVTLSDGQEYSSDRLTNDWTPLIISLAVMSRAHDESRMKSERVGAAWSRKKELARTEGRPLTPRCPEWLELKDGQFLLRPERVALVHRVFRETIEGYGRREIVRRLNAEGISTFRGGHGWHTSSVAKIIQSRAVLGEYQPHSGTHRARNRKPEGDPIPDYYPAILDEDIFWRAQAATQGRQQKAAGRKGANAHILQGLAVCTQCGSPMHLLDKGKPPKGGRYLACSSNLRNAGCDHGKRWRLDKIESALLTAVQWVEPESFDPLDNKSSTVMGRVTALQAKLDDLKKRQKTLVALVEIGDETAQARSIELAKQIKELSTELKAARADAAKLTADPGLAAQLIDAVSLSRQIKEADEASRRDLRVRLREILRKAIERIDCDPGVGPIAVFPTKFVFRLDGIAPFSLKTGENGNRLVLLDNSEEAQTAFFGPYDDWSHFSPIEATS